MHDTPAPGAAPSEHPPLALIAAVASNGVIGREGRLPWTLPDDLRRFRALTIGHSIVMGRKTWDSIKRPLPQRQNIVVSTQRELVAPGCDTAPTFEQAIAMATLPGPIFVIGGEALYRAALPSAAMLHLTEIDRAFAGDARFPAFDALAWDETARETHRLEGPDGFVYHFVTYQRSAKSAADSPTRASTEGDQHVRR